MQKEIVCIVEGQGDEVSVPILVRRIGVLIAQSLAIRCYPWRRSKGALIKPQGLEKDIEVAARRYPGASGNFASSGKSVGDFGRNHRPTKLRSPC
jgi:hypothetical protein